MREIDRQEGKPGADMQLTVDAKLQNYAQARLGKESASVIVMDCESGDLLSVVSSPTFDPNLFVRGISVADYRNLTEDNHRPLASKSVQGTYPPGSTFKMITALAALEDGIVGSDDTVYCPGHLEVADRRFHCWKRGGHGHVDLLNSLKQSCDVYYYDVAMRVGIDKISAMAQRFGLGTRHDIPMVRCRQRTGPEQRLEKPGARPGLADRRHGKCVDRTRVYAGLSFAAGGHDRPDRQRTQCGTASDQIN